MSSSEIAAALATNPSLVRKLVAPLVHAGLLVSAKGKHGGLALAKPPEEISLAEIYRTTIPDRQLLTARCVPHKCVVSRNFEPFLEDLSTAMEQAMLADLGSRTLEDALADLDARDKSRPPSTRRKRPQLT